MITLIVITLSGFHCNKNTFTIKKTIQQNISFKENPCPFAELRVSFKIIIFYLAPLLGLLLWLGMAKTFES